MNSVEKPLSELDGEIISIKGRPERNDCLFFTCPICPGGHGIMVSWRPPSLVNPGYVWSKTGSTIADITISPSINCDVPWTDHLGKQHPSTCKFHGWVRNGKVQW